MATCVRCGQQHDAAAICPASSRAQGARPAATAPARPLTASPPVAAPPIAAVSSASPPVALPPPRRPPPSTAVSPPRASPAPVPPPAPPRPPAPDPFAAPPTDPFATAAAALGDAPAAPTAAPAAEEPPPAEDAEAESWHEHFITDAFRGLRLVLSAAAELRKQPWPLITLAAVLFAPGALVGSCVAGAVTGPVVAAAVAAREPPAATVADDITPPRVLSGAETMVRGALGRFVTALVEGIGFGLVLCGFAFALGQEAAGRPRPSWRDTAQALAPRLPELVSNMAPAAALVALAVALVSWPGLAVLGPVAFVPALAFGDRVGGKPAIQRSVALAKAAPGRVMFVVLAVMAAGLAAHLAADLLVPDSGRRAVVVFTLLLADAGFVALLPVAAIAWFRLWTELRAESA